MGQEGTKLKSCTLEQVLRSQTLLIRPETNTTTPCGGTWHTSEGGHEQTITIPDNLTEWEEQLRNMSDDTLTNIWRGRREIERTLLKGSAKLTWSIVEQRWTGVRKTPVRLEVPSSILVSHQGVRNTMKKILRNKEKIPECYIEYMIKNINIIPKVGDTIGDILINVNQPNTRPTECRCKEIINNICKSGTESSTKW